MKPRHYILRDKKVEPATLFEWALFMSSGDRSVAQTMVSGFLVSTVFLGLDHNHAGKGPPVLWETMVFDADGPASDFQQHRCAGSWEQAEAMHERAVASVKSAFGITETENTPAKNG